MINVAFLTTWGSKCGISTYSEELLECLHDTDDVRVRVVAPKEEGSCDSAPEEIPFQMVWNRSDPNLPVVVPPFIKGCQIVHIQHEYGLFGHHESLLQLLRFLRRNYVKTVVTLHTVFPYGTWQSGIVDSIRSAADAMITHTAEAYAAASLARGKGVVVRIPHGTRVNVRSGVREEGLEFMGIPKNLRTAKFCGVVGFIGPSKNIISTIQAWADGVNRRLIDPSNWGVIIVGDIDERVYSYKLEIETARRDCGYAENIFIVPKFIPRAQMKNVMASFEFAVLNTRSHTLSASGQTHALASYGVPFCAADRPIYRDAIAAGAIPFLLNPVDDNYTLSTINAISALAKSDRMRDEIKKSLKNYAVETGWPIQAKRHIQLYKELLDD